MIPLQVFFSRKPEQAIGLVLELEEENLFYIKVMSYGICGLVVRVPCYRSRGPGSIPSTTRFSEK
jgi:hypothetical protein